MKKVVSDIRELADVGLNLVVDFAGFGTTTAGAIDVVANYGRVVQVGMGSLQAEINTNSLILKHVQLLDIKSLKRKEASNKDSC